jgi:hypothetical protein
LGLEKGMNGSRQLRPDPSDRRDGIGAGSKMSQRPHVFQTVSLLGEGIDISWTFTHHLERRRCQFDSLFAAL